MKYRRALQNNIISIPYFYPGSKTDTGPVYWEAGHFTTAGGELPERALKNS